MLPSIALSALASSSFAFGDPSKASAIPIPLQARSSLPVRKGIVIPEVLAHRGYWAANKHAVDTNDTRLPRSPTSFKRHSLTLDTGGPNAYIWTGQIEIGTQPRTQQFNVAIDTNKYDPSKSTSKEKLSGTFSGVYYDNTHVTGPIYADTVIISGLSAERQVFSPIEQVTALVNDGSDGILGLGYNNQLPAGIQSLLDTLYSQKKIPDRIFSIRLASDSGSELYIGGINLSKYEGSITYVPLESGTGYYWTVRGSVLANGEMTFQGQMVIDSGTSFIYGRKNFVRDWWSKVPGAAPCRDRECGGPGYYMYPCNSPPRLSLKFGEREFPVSTEDFKFRETSHNMCVGVVCAHDDKDPLQDTWIIGNRFMKNVYTIFDVGREQIGFATPI
ncbi:unnamed protein product [Rhizoctonia solani]|uniref:Peptidase A1 domain-containing protein n=1 Tax=Rhizoctonia solani TaxID=456999 RepID=A0A8H3BUF4_9AGAM|nr:unnamed protein product [Rhizoctonia solani]